MDLQHQLSYAVQIGDSDKVRELLAQGAAVNDHPVEMSGSPLHQAADEGHVAIVDLLLEHGADINAVDEDSRTPLHIAAYQGCTEVVHMLLRRGAQYQAVDKQGNTWVHLAARFGRWEVLKLLLEGDWAAGQGATGGSQLRAGPWSHLPQASAIASRLFRRQDTAHGSLEPLPSGWSPAGAFRVDGSSLEHVAPTTRNPCMIRSDHPVPDDCTLYFYEVEVVEGTITNRISIGLTDPADSSEAHVGWTDHSYGYHGDDGNMMHANHSCACGRGPLFTSGDVIGVLWDRLRRTIRFFKNSRDVHFTFSNVDEQLLHPAVASRAFGARLRSNFGERPWATQAAAMPLLYALEHRHQPLLLLLLPKLSEDQPQHAQNLVADLLLCSWGTVLYRAAAQGDVALLQLALDHTRDVDGGRLPHGLLSTAVASGSADAVQLLFDRTPEKFGEQEFGSALVAAAMHGHRHIVRLFVQQALPERNISMPGNARAFRLPPQPYVRSIKASSCMGSRGAALSSRSW